jgi:hypothetical protein
MKVVMIIAGVLIGGFLLRMAIGASTPQDTRTVGEVIHEACAKQYDIAEQISQCELREGLRVLNARERSKQDAVDSEVGTP